MDRAILIERLRANLERYGWPRVVLVLAVSLSGFGAFVVSYALLSAGVRSMPLRYGVAGAAGYLAFLGLLAAWVAWKRRGGDVADAVEYLDVATPGSGGSFDGFGGGRSGGGGASAAWGTRSPSSSHTATSSRGGWWLDGDSDVGWVLVAIVLLLAGALAVVYVVWIAPALLAEVLVDAAVVSAVSRRVARVEPRDWTATVLRRTWLPAAILIATIAAAGYALQQAVPDARSIGPALDALLDR